MTPFDDLLRACLDPVPAHWPATHLRRAAVLCPVIEHAGADHVLFTERPTTLKRHAGQIGFPGGMRDNDEDPIATALRECDEELGIAASRITVLGALPPREASSNIAVLCLVGRLEPGPLEPDPREVARVLHVPFDELLDTARWQELPPPIGRARPDLHLSPHFRYGSDLLWGLTGRFVRELVRRLARAG